MNNEEILNQVVEEMPLKDRSDIGKGHMGDFLNTLVASFYEKQVENFPVLCEETRMTNIQHLKQLEAVGNKTPTRMVGGKVYEGSSGWSKDLSFKFKWIVPMQLKNFMRNCIYTEFWNDENHKVRDKFMKGILKGDDPYELLKWVRGVYGGSNDQRIIQEKVNG